MLHSPSLPRPVEAKSAKRESVTEKNLECVLTVDSFASAISEMGSTDHLLFLLFSRNPQMYSPRT